MAENLEIRKQEFAGRIQEMTGKSLEEALREVDVSINRLFHWGAYCDKYGGSVQVLYLYYCF
jgi:aldehyde dehydrogenase (NAD+)